MQKLSELNAAFPTSKYYQKEIGHILGIPLHLQMQTCRVGFLWQ